jgi:hypothetical protein
MPEPTGAYEPSYTWHSTFFEKPEGEYAVGPDLRECLTCGALVGDTARHDAWHASGESGESRG